jgi:hypothetical protein
MALRRHQRLSALIQNISHAFRLFALLAHNALFLGPATFRQCCSKVLYACNAVPSSPDCSAAGRRVRSWSRRPGAYIGYSWTAQPLDRDLG